MAKGVVKTQVIDRGEARIRRVIDELEKTPGGPHVKCGVLESAGMEKGDGKDSLGLKVVDVAIFNEFGAKLKHGEIPERPFMRTAAKKLEPIMAELGARLLAAMIAGRTTLDAALQVLGLKAQAEIKKTIRDWESPPNAESTILKKARKTGRLKIMAKVEKARKDGQDAEAAYAAALAGYNNPLEDTGQLRNSIDFVKVK